MNRRATLKSVVAVTCAMLAFGPGHLVALEMGADGVTRFSGTATGLGREENKAGLQIVGRFRPLRDTIDLRVSTVTITSLLDETGGRGELVRGLPLVLSPVPGSGPDLAIFEDRARPNVVSVELKNLRTGEFNFRIKLGIATIDVPDLCSPTPLTTTVKILDGLGPAVLLTTEQPWNNFGPNNQYLRAPARATTSLAELVAAGDRDCIRAWAAGRSIAEINAEVAALSEAERDRLAEVVLHSNATGATRELLLRTMRHTLARPVLGFYAEIWSYTFIELTGDGFFGTCRHLFLDPDAFGGLSDLDARNVLVHETFHSFNCVNGGPVGSLDEGAAIWVIPVGFDEPLLPGQSWAETTYGTKLFYRDVQGVPDFPLGAPLAPTAKLLEVYELLAAHDPSRLPWNSTDRLVACFQRYFEHLDRNVDFFDVWLPAVAAATASMLEDAECRPL